MTSIAAVSSTRSHARVVRAGSWLRAGAPAKEVLVVGASLDAANEVVRGVAAERGSAFGWHRLTLPHLAATLAAPGLASRALAPLSRLGAEALITRVVHRLRREDGLGRYRIVADTPGFPRAIAGVITELRLATLGPDAVEGVAPDLAPLMTAYEAELADAGLTDWPGLLTIAVEAASGTAGRHHLIGLPMLFLDVPITTAAELALVRVLAQAAPEMLFTLPAADEQALRRISAGLVVRVDDLDQVAPRKAPAGRLSTGSLARLQRRLFREEAAPEEQPDNEVEVFSAPGEGRESVEIARRVLALAREGVPFDRIAVLLRSPAEYRSHLEEAFARARIPAHFARGAVRPDPTGRAFYALLRCAAEGLSARRFAEYLSLGQVPDAMPDGTPPEAAAREDRWTAPGAELVPQTAARVVEEAAEVAPPERPPADREEAPVRDGQLRAPRRWEKLLVDAAVIGGRDRWRRRIHGLANEIRLSLAEISDEDETRAATLQRTLDDLAAFAAYSLPLIDDLDALPEAAVWGDWLDRLGALATRSLKQPERVLGVLSELAPMAPVGPVALKEVLLVLEDLLLEVAVPPPSQRYGKVFIGPIEAARGLSFDTVFVPGLAEKMFPRKIVEEPILLDALRDQIEGVLATNQTRLDKERLALAIAAGAAERRIFFSYPRLDLDQARPRVPSFYALETVRAATGRLPDFAELARQAETATTTRLGWPAPPDPADAIDDAEHDLAILGRVAGLPGESPGAARYLLTANPNLARALRARYQRWGRSWTSADGLTSRSEAVRAIMARHTLGVRSYSPTALQNYAACPYRFFLQTIQGLAPREVPEAIDELDPLHRGSLIHDVQFELFANLRDENLLPVRPGNLEQARLRLDAVIAEVAARYRDDLAPAIARIWEDGISAIRADHSRMAAARQRG